MMLASKRWAGAATSISILILHLLLCPEARPYEAGPLRQTSKKLKGPTHQIEARVGRTTPLTPQPSLPQHVLFATNGYRPLLQRRYSSRRDMRWKLLPSWAYWLVGVWIVTLMHVKTHVAMAGSEWPGLLRWHTVPLVALNLMRR